MKDTVEFHVKIIKGNEGNLTILNSYNLNELNKILQELEESFLGGIEESIFIKDITKDEFIFYRNELGIKVKGIVKNYQIQQDLLEYLIKLNLLNKNKSSIFPIDETFKETSFYTKTITVKKYFIEDVSLSIEVSISILDGRKDIEV